MKISLSQSRTAEKGYALISVMILLLLGALIIPPLLTYTSTGLQTGAIYEEDARELYAADAGINDSLWYTQYGDLNDTLGPTFNEYDYSSTWPYTLSEDINAETTTITIQNMWIPKGITAPSTVDATDIIETGKLIVTGNVPSPGIYEIKTVFNPETGDDLDIDTLGVWLPPGFDYVYASCNLSDNISAPYFTADPTITPHASGWSLVWDLIPNVGIEEFGPTIITTESPASITSVIQFRYEANVPGQVPSCVSWVTTNTVAGIPLPLAWDADTKVYKIISTAGDAEIEAYASKCELRQLGAAMSGDYCAIGNALMTATGSVKYRDRLLKQSDAVVGTGNSTGEIPSTASIQAAWLYWSGWIEEGCTETIWNDDCDDFGGGWQTIWQDDCSSFGTSQTIWQDDCSSFGTSQTIWQDDCSSFGTWETVWQDDCSSFGTEWEVLPPGQPIGDPNCHWATASGEFRGWGSGTDDDRTLTRTDSIDLSAYSTDTVVISWEQHETGFIGSSEGLYFEISGDGGSTWPITEVAFLDDIGSTPQPFSYTIPSGYVTNGFRIRFYWEDSSSSEYCFIDNIKIERLVSSEWSPGANWEVVSGEFRGKGGGSADERKLTRTESIDLSAYSTDTVIISWEQDANWRVDSTDYLYFAISNDGGGSWSGNIEAFHDDSPTSPYSYTIPSGYLTNGFRIKFFWQADSSDEYCYIDNIDIATFSGEWSPGANWEVSSGMFRGRGSSSDDDRTLTRIESIDLSAYSTDTVVISWEQDANSSVDFSDYLYFAISGDDGGSWSSDIVAFYDDDPTSPFSYTLPSVYVTSGFRIKFFWQADSSDEYCYIDDIDVSVFSGEWSPGSNWEVASGEFRGRGSGSDDDRTLTRVESINLSAYSGKTVAISWEQDASYSVDSTDYLYFAISNDGGGSWSSYIEAFHDDNPYSPYSYTIPNPYLTSGFRIKFLWQADSSDEYCYIDNIDISAAIGGAWVVGSNWEATGGEFKGHGGGSADDRTLTQSSGMDLSAYSGEMVTISWKQDEGGTLEEDDSLKYAFSKDGGSNWSALEIAFSDDNPFDTFYRIIPYNYMTSNFMIKFYFESDDTDEWVYIDDITITLHNIDVDRVVFNDKVVTADRQQFAENDDREAVVGTYSYSCFYDATDDVKDLIDDGTLATNGAGTYTVGHIVEAKPGYPSYSYELYPTGEDTGYPLGIPSDTISDSTKKEYTYAGWSLILVYVDPETKGHQLYLFDDFTFVGEEYSLQLPVSGFLAPDDPTGSRITCFVGEGDDCYGSLPNERDFITVNGNYLSDAMNDWYNVWNSYSNALDNPTINGIDLDTFDISSYIVPGATSATVILESDFEIYNSIYVILSFRSDITSGGTITYLIRG